MSQNEMQEAYLFEMNSLLDSLDNFLLKQEQEHTLPEDSVNFLFRVMHTIKGCSAMMEYDSVASVAHHMEDVLSFIRENGLAEEHYAPLFELIFHVTDFVREQLQQIEQQMPLSNNIGSLTQEINAFLKIISENVKNTKPASKPLPAPDAEAEPEAAPSYEDYPYGVRVRFDADAKMENVRAFMLKTSVSRIASAVCSTPEHPESCPPEQLAKEGFLLHFASAKDVKSCLPLLQNNPCVANVETIFTAQRESAAEKAASSHAPAAPSQTSKLITVDLRSVDSMLEMLNRVVEQEFVVASDGQAAAMPAKFAEQLRSLQDMTNTLQSSLLSLRMVPMDTVFSRMYRVVRDMNKKLGKDAHLVMHGETTVVDKDVADLLCDPLIQAVRNSMDHGIESAEVRAKRGKPASGAITLTAFKAGGMLTVTVEDDGNGFSRQDILAKADQLGWLTKAPEEYSDDELFHFLLLPGFSTEKSVTEFSGRGVGMDLIQKAVSEAGGTVSLRSSEGVSSTLELTLPMTPPPIIGVELLVGGTTVMVPVGNLLSMVHLKPSQLSGDGHAALYQGQTYPILHLHELWNIPGAARPEDGALVLANCGRRKAFILADSIGRRQQVTCKPLTDNLREIWKDRPGVAGCATLRTGETMVILSPESLIS